jgi:protein involved in sex pheromone biosynthesis
MKKTMLAAVIPVTLVLAACGSSATEETEGVETAVLDDDNDAPEPVAEPIPEDEPHDESVPHDH